MAKDMVATKGVAALPAHLQKLALPAAFNEFTQGVVSGFPVISYRGKVWRVRKGGDEQLYTNDEGEAMQSIDIVLVKSNPQPSKIFYEKKYEEGDEGRPRCFSADGFKPDPSVEDPIAPACGACKNNQWGSRITDAGKKTRACGDTRRMVVVFKHQLEEVAAGTRPRDELDTMLMRVPAASLNPLRDYVDKILKPKGVQPFYVVSRVGFNTDASYPQLTFKAVRFLSEEETNVLLELRESEETRRILAEATEHGTGETTDASEAAASAPAERTAEAKASASPAPTTKGKRVAVEEEEISLPPTAQALVEEEEEEEETPPQRAAAVEAEAIDPPPAPKKTGKKKAATPADEPDFEKMLSSILD